MRSWEWSRQRYRDWDWDWDRDSLRLLGESSGGGPRGKVLSRERAEGGGELIRVLIMRVDCGTLLVWPWGREGGGGRGSRASRRGWAGQLIFG